MSYVATLRPFLCVSFCSSQASSQWKTIGVPIGEVSLVAQAADGDEATIMCGDKVEQSRWVVPANGSQLLVMQFQSVDMGTFRENLVFEVWPLRLCMHHLDERCFHQVQHAPHIRCFFCYINAASCIHISD